MSLWQPFGSFWALHKHTLRRHAWFFFIPNCRIDKIEWRNAMKGEDSALSRYRNLAKIKLLCCDSGHRDSGWTRKSKRIGGRYTYFSFTYNVFSYSKLKSRLEWMSLAKKNHFENFGDFRRIGPLKSFNLRRLFRWALGSRGGGAHALNGPPWIRASCYCLVHCEIWR